MFEQRVMHFPEVVLLTCCFGSHCAEHGVCVNTNEREVMKFQPQFIGITAQDLLHEGMIGAAARTLVIAKFNQRHLGVLRPPEVATALDINRWRRGNLWPAIGVPAEQYRSTRSQSDKDYDDNGWFQELLHAANTNRSSPRLHHWKCLSN